MKIIILHGDYYEKTYDQLQFYKEKARSEGLEIIQIDLKKDVSEQLVSKSLFEKEMVYILEDVNKLTNSDFNWLNSYSKKIKGNLIIIDRNKIKSNLINKFSISPKVEEFKLPKVIWNFLDSFYPGNSSACLKIFQDLKDNEPDVFVFALLAKHLKDLIILKLDKEVLEYPKWRIAKLESQAGKFSLSDLKKIISEMSKIDIKVKTSNENLFHSLDFLIATKLE